ncbi:hypothetical protein E2C01_089774 [Portunus trituberculatus]|uniref:Uncharacterized protein n=1 Tax=Portunus trituberculatus TaxID=210409 RepID=A0A5B7JNC6_PORTR|nr:hypothetical protein [Portunus trituberculatus]
MGIGHLISVTDQECSWPVGFAIPAECRRRDTKPAAGWCQVTAGPEGELIDYPSASTGGILQGVNHCR